MVIRPGGNVVHLLRRQRVTHGICVRQRGERAVIIAAPISQPVAASVKPDQWHHDGLRRQNRTIWHTRAKPSRLHDAVGRPYPKYEGVPAWRRFGQQDRSASSRQSMADRSYIKFVR